MADLIDRQAAIDAIEHRLAEPAYQHTGEDWYAGMNCAECELYDLPSAQPEIIRCRECKWYLPNYTKSPFDTDGFNRWGGLANCQNEMGVAECNEEDYCSFGERRES